MSTIDIEKTLETFEKKTIRVKTAGEQDFGIRYYDNENAFPRGAYLFDQFPATRNSLALKTEWNKMTNFKQWQIRPKSIIIEGRAAPQGTLPGGGNQMLVFPSTNLFE